MPHMIQTKIRQMTLKNLVVIIASVTVFCTLIAQCSLTIQAHQCLETHKCIILASEAQINAIYGLAIFNLIMILLLISIQVVFRV